MCPLSGNLKKIFHRSLLLAGVCKVHDAVLEEKLHYHKDHYTDTGESPRHQGPHQAWGGAAPAPTEIQETTVGQGEVWLPQNRWPAAAVLLGGRGRWGLAPAPLHRGRTGPGSWDAWTFSATGSLPAPSAPAASESQLQGEAAVRQVWLAPLPASPQLGTAAVPCSNSAVTRPDQSL